MRWVYPLVPRDLRKVGDRKERVRIEDVRFEESLKQVPRHWVRSREQVTARVRAKEEERDSDVGRELRHLGAAMRDVAGLVLGGRGRNMDWAFRRQTAEHCCQGIIETRKASLSLTNKGSCRGGVNVLVREVVARRNRCTYVQVSIALVSTRIPFRS